MMVWTRVTRNGARSSQGDLSWFMLFSEMYEHSSMFPRTSGTRLPVPSGMFSRLILWLWVDLSSWPCALRAAISSFKSPWQKKSLKSCDLLKKVYLVLNNLTFPLTGMLLFTASCFHICIHYSVLYNLAFSYNSLRYVF